MIAAAQWFLYYYIVNKLNNNYIVLKAIIGVQYYL